MEQFTQLKVPVEKTKREREMIEAQHHAIKMGCARAASWMKYKPKCFGKINEKSHNDQLYKCGLNCKAYIKECRAEAGK